MKYASKRGKRHEFQNLLCQDRVCHKERGEVKIIALADGTSPNDICIVGVEKVLDAVCDKIIEQYDEIEEYIKENQKATVQGMLTQKIKMEIEKLAIRYQVSERMFSSTILLVCLNTKRNSFFSLHLGDGIIICRKNGSYQVLSSPENGIQKNQTYLTTSSNAREHLRISSHSLDGISEFVLASDGMYELPLTEELKGNEERSILEIATKSLESVLGKSNNFEEKIDDQSMIMIYNY